jgi:excisionase family DNA binding protein
VLTIAETAARLRVSRSAVREYYRFHGLPIVRLSHRTLRVREEDLDRWLESRVENGAPA